MNAEMVLSILIVLSYQIVLSYFKYASYTLPLNWKSTLSPTIFHKLSSLVPKKSVIPPHTYKPEVQKAFKSLGPPMS